MQEQNTNKGGVCDCLAGLRLPLRPSALSDLPVLDLCAAGVVCEEGGRDRLRQLRQKTGRIRARLFAGTALNSWEAARMIDLLTCHGYQVTRGRRLQP
jgi:hypothetical protein